MTDANKALARRWYEEVWNGNNHAALDELLAPSAETHGFPRPDAALHGSAAFRQSLHDFRDGFSEIRVHVDEVIGEGDTVAVRWTAHMRHTGPGLGVQPTGRAVTVPGASFLCVKDGRITEGWESMDLTRVRRELESAALALTRCEPAGLIHA
jgi:predicted ester cyclase